MRSLRFLPLLLLLLIVGCNREGDHYTHRSARQAAERFYAHLIEGRYDDYVSARYDSDSLPQAYRSQLIDLAAQFMAQQRKTRGGILSATAMADTLIEADSSARVRLDLVFADSLREEISIALVFRNEKWKMK